jgi:hypothetical protein
VFFRVLLVSFSLFRPGAARALKKSSPGISYIKGLYFNIIVISNKKRGRRSIRKDKDKKKIRPFIVKVRGLNRAKAY